MRRFSSKYTTGIVETADANGIRVTTSKARVSVPALFHYMLLPHGIDRHAWGHSLHGECLSRLLTG